MSAHSGRMPVGGERVPVLAWEGNPVEKPDVYAHPDYLAMIRSMREEPADDTRRLACADWLDEHGEHERAEFVRVQVELARGPAGIDCRRVTGYDSGAGLRYGHRDTTRYDCFPALPCPPRPPLGTKVVARVLGQPRHDWSRFEGTCCAWVDATDGPAFTLMGVKASQWKPELTARERELLSAEFVSSGGTPRDFKNLWAPRELTDRGDTDWQFRRGFIEHATCAAETWLAHGDAILALHPVTRVTLSTCPRDTGRFVNFKEFGRRWDGITFNLTAGAFNAGVREVISNTATTFNLPAPVAGSP